MGLVFLSILSPYVFWLEQLVHLHSKYLLIEMDYFIICFVVVSKDFL